MIDHYKIIIKYQFISVLKITKIKSLDTYPLTKFLSLQIYKFSFFTNI